MRRVLVMGASGNTGGALMEQLHGDAVVPVAASRGGGTGSDSAARFEHRECHFGNEEQVAAALAGIDVLFLMVPFHEEMVAWGEQFVAEAKRQSVGLIVRLSGLGAGLGCASKMGALHGQIDHLVKQSGVDYCILRCNSFMQNFSGLYRKMIQRSRTISLAEGDSRSCFIDTADIAAVAARIIFHPQAYRNQVYDLSGPEPLGNVEVADIISNAIGETVRYRPVSDEEAERSYRKMGLSAWRIEVLTSLSQFIRAGNAAEATADVARVLGRPPTDFRRFADMQKPSWK